MNAETKSSGPLGWYFNINLLVRILVGLAVGAVVGLIVGPEIRWISPFGDLFVRLLRMIVMPVIFASLVVGASSISPARLGRVGVKIIVYYMLTSAVAVIIGLVLANILQPGAGLDLAGAGVTAAGRELKQPDLIAVLLGLVPTNPIESLARGEVLPVIFFAIVFGIALSYLQASSDERIKRVADATLSFFEGVAEVMYKVVHGVLQYAPFGVFALIAVVFGLHGARAFGALGMVTAAVYIALILHVIIIYGGFLTVFKLNFFRFLGGAREAMLTAFVTRSSSATLPVTMDNAENKLGIPRNIASFTLPLGATINMDGTAIYQGICTLFVAYAIGAPLNLTQQATVVLTAVLASIGTAGVPGAGAIMLLMVLNSVGMPVTEGTPVAMAYAMILGIDALLDMGRTSVNVTGDIVGSSIVAKSEKELDLSKWTA